MYYVHLEDRLGRDSSICPRADRISIRRWSDGRGTATCSRPIVTEEAWEEKPQNKLMLFASRQGSRIFFAYRTYSYSVCPEHLEWFEYEMRGNLVIHKKYRYSSEVVVVYLADL